MTWVMQICGYLKGSWYIIYYHGSSFLGGGARIKMKYDLLLVSVTRWSVETYAKLRPAKPKTRACLENPLDMLFPLPLFLEGFSLL